MYMYIQSVLFIQLLYLLCNLLFNIYTYYVTSNLHIYSYIVKQEYM